MTKLIPLFAGSILVTVVAHLVAAQTDPDEAVVNRWIPDLDSAHFQIRERAAKKLFSLQERAIDPLKKALQIPNKDLEFRRRVEMLLREVKVFERAGEPENGLRMNLQASNDTLKVGDQMTLRTTLINLSEKDLVIQVRWHFVRGLHSITNQLHIPDFYREEIKRKPRPVTLPANESTTFTTVVTLRRFERQKNMVGLELGDGEGFLDLLANGSNRLRMIHTVNIDEATLREFSRERQRGLFKKSAELWSGTVRSNDVVIYVAAD
jgi:hypothetical protein